MREVYIIALKAKQYIHGKIHYTPDPKLTSPNTKIRAGIDPVNVDLTQYFGWGN